ncbi:dihydroorotate dehydrogenase [Kosmotoga arenicorallina S304]|uniref:Dihydrothymine dehydrogenase n=1 Tax=Kosmotoga arenicorallina S304 TaxID=1453497 RepID=A0A176JXJ9_9BACT|nr:4Fe-4S binding protein [Kosmotoga arenicorallina]OAA28439.1 dihydroorotate dehydrogenase [Kosmotoga arenicorallina S304]
MDLSVEIAGIKLKNPVMPASGPLTGDDKKMLALERLGVGGMVTKTISSKAAEVPRPCIIAGNNYVMNTELWTEFPPEKWESEFLPAYRAKSNIPLIVSLGYTPDDLNLLVPRFDRFADGFELSTHYVADDPKLMKQLIKAVKIHTDKPVFLKFDPSVPDPEGMAKTIEDAGGDGIVIMNSLGPAYPLDRNARKSFLGSKDGFGWISGPVIKPLSLAMVKRVAKATSLPVIGVGGISSAQDVIEFLMAGAAAVQLLSAALIRGKSVYKRIVDELPEKLKKIGAQTAGEIVGIAKDSNSKASFKRRLPVIDKEKCTLCGLCVDICPYFALTIENNAVAVNQEECFGCGLCQSRCPVKAIGGVLE